MKCLLKLATEKNKLNSKNKFTAVQTYVSFSCLSPKPNQYEMKDQDLVVQLQSPKIFHSFQQQLLLDFSETQIHDLFNECLV